MFNLLRLFRRDDHIDDTAAAYIEGRANEREQAELRDRAAREPGLIEDLDSIRDTVSLLRSIESVSAPRSFALSEAPVQIRVKRSRVAMAPAAFAIAAAAMVGLLAVGNLADVVRQSDGDGSAVSETSRNFSADSISTDIEMSQLESVAAIAEVTGPDGPAGEPGDPGLPGLPGSAGTDTEDVGAAAQSGTGPSAISTPTILPFATNVPDGARVEPIKSPTQSSGDGAGVSGGQAPGTEPLPSLDPESIGSDGGEPDLRLPQTPPTGGSSQTAESDEPGFKSDEALALPNATTTANLSLANTQNLAAAEPSDEPTTGSKESGFALPLWQLQTLFASIAVIMAGAWMLLQRRLTA